MLPAGFFAGAQAQILRCQRADGAIAWFPDGTVDPWNHLEAVMGLGILGERACAERGFQFLFDTQHRDGSWQGQMGGAVPIDEDLQNFTLRNQQPDFVRDTNHCAYLPAAVWHHYLLFADIGFVKKAWAHITQAMHFVLGLQRPTGEIRWAAEEPVTAQDIALLSGCASIYKSLASANRLAALLSEPQEQWQEAQQKLGTALQQPELFANKDNFSMDWYYPILCGAITGATAEQRISKHWSQFVVEGVGCLCTTDEPWVTFAETAELVLTLLRMGQREQAEQLLGWIDDWRDTDGSYWMGRQVQTNTFWPIEHPPWTAGAILLASDAVRELTPACKFFLE